MDGSRSIVSGTQPPGDWSCSLARRGGFTRKPSTHSERGFRTNWRVVNCGAATRRAGVLAHVHISPWAVDPPQDVLGPYTNPVAGYIAFETLLALTTSVVIGSVYAAVLWHRHDR